MQEEIKNLQFVWGVNFELVFSLKNIGAKYLIIFNDSCDGICNSKTFVDFHSAGKHRGLGIMYNTHNFVHHSKIGQEVELQNTHIVLFKSLRNVMQVSTLNAHLKLVSQLVDCYRDETSLPYGHLLIDLSPRTDDRLRYCTNTGSIPSKFYIPDRLKQIKFSDDENTKSLYFPSVPIIFGQMQESFRSVFPEELIRCLCECRCKSSGRKPGKHKIISFRNFKTKFGCSL